MLARYVREKKTLTLEDAVRKMSGFPADRLRLLDRGLLKPGMKADYTNLHQYAEGVTELIINGEPVISAGNLTERRPGRILKGPSEPQP